MQYSNDNGVTFGLNNVFTNLCVGNYDIIVEDANGCQTVANEPITEPAPLTVTLGITDPICNTLDNEECDNNSDCFWQNDITAAPHEPSQGLYFVEFNYSGTFDYSVTIPWIDYTINGSIIVNDYEN